MAKTTKFSELRAQMSSEAQAGARCLADDDLKEMPLHELRAARHLTQQQLAKSLDMTQAAVSQLEQRTDIYHKLDKPAAFDVVIGFGPNMCQTGRRSRSKP